MSVSIRTWLFALSTLFCLSQSITVLANPGNANIRIAAPSSWVEIRQPHKASAPQHTGGVFYEWIENQVYFDGTKTHRFKRRIIEIKNAAGLNDASEIEIHFDQHYQKLVLHDIVIHRNGHTLDMTRKTKKEVAKTESDFQDSLLNGASTALLIVPNVKVGDRVEYRFSILGSNPVFDGHFFTHQRTAWNVPVGHSALSIKVPEGTSLKLKQHLLPPPKVQTQAGYTQYRWDERDVNAVKYDKRSPYWYEPGANVSASTFNDWQAVERWGSELFPAYRPPRHPELKKLIASLKQLDTFAEQTEKALAYVQQDIRYFGIEVGENSHRPHSPAKVIERGYGDCKDKTQLLISILKSLGIAASPALVHSRIRAGIKQELPSPGAFNHVITRVDLNGKTYWLDATDAYERGQLDVRGDHEFGYALVLHSDERKLIEIPKKAYKHPQIHLDETVVLGFPYNASEVTITSTYRGKEANHTRSRILSKGLHRLDQDFYDFQKKQYPESRQTQPLSFEDDEHSNILITREHYEIKEFARLKGKQYAYTFKETGLQGHLPDPSTFPDGMPLALNDRTYVQHTRSYVLPFTHWPTFTDDVSSVELKLPGLIYQNAQSQVGRIHQFVSSLKIDRPFLQADEMARYRDFYKVYNEHYAYTYSFNTHADAKEINRLGQALSDRLEQYAEERGTR